MSDRPPGKLLNALTAMGDLRLPGDRYSLAPESRKWLLRSSPNSLCDWILEQEVIEWRWMDEPEAFLRSGGALDLHDHLPAEHWALYQRGRRTVGGDLARRVARALQPGGYYVVVDVIRPRSPKEGGQIGTLGNLFFTLTSRAGT